VRAVAARVGVTPALVAHYRPVMESFVAEIFTTIVAAEREEVIASYDSDVDLRTNLLRLIETLLDDSRDDVAMVWVQSWALGARNEALGIRVRAEMDLWHSALEDLIARAVEGGGELGRHEAVDGLQPVAEGAGGVLGVLFRGVHGLCPFACQGARVCHCACTCSVTCDVNACQVACKIDV